MRILPHRVLWLLAASALTSAASVRAQDPSPGSQWPSINNHLDGQRFAPLREITPDNAAQLREVCRLQVDGPTTFESGLVVVDGVIYTNTGLQTVAIDATTCALRWKFSYVPDEASASATNRGLAVLDGRVFRGTGDARLLALDAATGKLLWKTVIGAPRLGEAATAAPLAWGGVVYMGISGGETGARGRVMAYDAQSGRELWRFNTVPTGNETGANTWKRPESAKTGGGAVWGTLSLDVTTAELFVPVGNPWPDIDKGYRPGANLFTDSMVVLDARTGALKWWHQETAEDWADRDLVAGPVLYRDSRIRDVLAFGGKDGYVTGVDRDTHQVLFHTPVTTVESPPAGATESGVRICPGYAGGVEWNGPTLDSLNNTLITGAVDICFKVKSGPTHYSLDAGSSFGGTAEPDGPGTGWITALDSETGTVRWRYHAERPVVAAVTPTAGGVTFTGDLNGNFLVLDSKTGGLLYKTSTGGALAGGVVTYESGGRQYVAFASGNVSRLPFGALGLPSVVIMAIGGKHAGAVPAAGTASAAGLTSPVGPSASAVGPAPSVGPAAATGPSPGVASPSVSGGDRPPATPWWRSNSPAQTADAGTPLARGRKLYVQACTTCHGLNGNFVAGHELSTLLQRRDLDATIRYIKDPKPPMPKLYPALLDEQAVADVANYVLQEIAH